MYVRVIEERSSWWKDSGNTCMLLNNAVLMKANSDGIIDEEIQKLMDDINFLQTLKNKQFTSAWNLFYDGVIADLGRMPLADKPVHKQQVQEKESKRTLLVEEPNSTIDYTGMSTEEILRAQEAYPAQLFILDDLTATMRKYAEIVKNSTIGANKDAIKKVLTTTRETLERIDAEMIAVNYTFNNVDAYKLYTEKVDLLKKYLVVVKGGLLK